MVWSCCDPTHASRVNIHNIMFHHKWLIWDGSATIWMQNCVCITLWKLEMWYLSMCLFVSVPDEGPKVGVGGAQPRALLTFSCHYCLCKTSTSHECDPRIIQFERRSGTQTTWAGSAMEDHQAGRHSCLPLAARPPGSLPIGRGKISAASDWFHISKLLISIGSAQFEWSGIAASKSMS